MNIFDEVSQHLPHIHHDQHQEHTMQPQQQQPRLVDSLHAITGEIQANPLVSRLLEYGLGKQLSAVEADHITGLIASLEQNRAHTITYAEPPAVPPHDGTQQQPVQQPTA